QLERGDLFVLYTDGVTEAMNRSREEYSEARFKQTLLKARDQPLEKLRESVLASIRNFVDDAPAHDDITLVLLRRTD
ncbi:MAG: PP2C family protein-serine/threonine phosphatase, partial [bacterium]